MEDPTQLPSVPVDGTPSVGTEKTTGPVATGVILKTPQVFGNLAAQAAPAPVPAAAGETPPESDATAQTASQPGSDAWADLADKEAALIESRRQLKAEREAMEYERARAYNEGQAYARARALIQQGDHLGALAALGLDPGQAADQYLASQQEKTPEQKAAEVAAAEVQRQLQARDAYQQQMQAWQAQQAQQQQAQEYLRAAEVWQAGVVDVARALGPEKWSESYDLINAYELTAEDVMNQAMALEMVAARTENRESRMPLPKEALDLVEKHLGAKASKSKRFRPIDTGDPNETSHQARDRAATTLSSAATGSVPLRKPNGQQRRETVQERLERAKREVLGR